MINNLLIIYPPYAESLFGPVSFELPDDADQEQFAQRWASTRWR